jgi:hypothetical protein
MNLVRPTVARADGAATTGPGTTGVGNAVDCEQAANLTSARLDGELAPADAAGLDAHLAGCAACRAAAEGIELQDAALVRAFAGGGDAAAALARRVTDEMTAATPTRTTAVATTPAAAAALPANGRSRWATSGGWRTCVGWAAAAAAGFAAAVVLVRPARPPAVSSVSSSWPQQAFPVGPADPVGGVEPVARLVLASGAVFTCPDDRRPWQPMATGDGLAPGAKVRTADAAKCELTLPGGSRLRLNAGTELRFASARDVRLAGGQLWSDVPSDADPLRVAAGDACVTTGAPAARFDVACAAGSAAVTVVEGAARVDGPGRAGSPGRATTVRGGELVHVPATDAAAGTGIGDAASAALMCTPVADPLAATRWLDDLLVLRPGDDPELAARVDALLARVAAEHAAADMAAATPTTGPVPVATSPGPVERDLRARGQAWAVPLARYAVAGAPGPAGSAPAGAESGGARSAAVDLGKRRAAARLLADLATSPCVPDLVGLLADDDAEVRSRAAAALGRLTGRTLGFSPDRFAAEPRDPAPAAAWRAWLDGEPAWAAGRGPTVAPPGGLAPR